jgi:hypothetical protein
MINYAIACDETQAMYDKQTVAYSLNDSSCVCAHCKIVSLLMSTVKRTGRSICFQPRIVIFTGT